MSSINLISFDECYYSPHKLYPWHSDGIVPTRCLHTTVGGLLEKVYS